MRTVPMAKGACRGKLFAGIEGYLANIRDGGGGPHDEVEAAFRRLIHGRSENDTFAQELDSAVLALQTFLCPHLQQAS
jgi:hypothetical protein